MFQYSKRRKGFLGTDVARGMMAGLGSLAKGVGEGFYSNPFAKEGDRKWSILSPQNANMRRMMDIQKGSIDPYDQDQDRRLKEAEIGKLLAWAKYYGRKGGGKGKGDGDGDFSLGGGR